MDIAIAGAGIGGLTAALSLHAAGHNVLVFESATEIRPLGVGINLQPNALRILSELGAGDHLLKLGVQTRELSYFNKLGQLIWTEPRGKFAGFAAPQISIGRGPLQLTLYERAKERSDRIKIVTGHRLQSFDTRAGRAFATVSTPDNTTDEIEADILICADGIHSAARAQMYPNEGPPIYSGRILWRATSLAKPFLSSASMFMAGYEDQKFVCYPIEPVREDGLQRINWIAELRRPYTRNREDWNRQGDFDDFLPQFSDWNFDWLSIPQLIEAADEVYEFPMVDRDPVPSWTDGRVTLLGDAAHSMYPIGSNGASQAILDAETLTMALQTNANAEDALRAYEKERLPATAAIVKANRGNGPEECMQLAHERAPTGFNSVDDIFADGELQAIADKYKQLTGMKPK